MWDRTVHRLEECTRRGFRGAYEVSLRIAPSASFQTPHRLHSAVPHVISILCLGIPEFQSGMVD